MDYQETHRILVKPIESLGAKSLQAALGDRFVVREKFDAGYQLFRSKRYGALAEQAGERDIRLVRLPPQFHRRLATEIADELDRSPLDGFRPASLQEAVAFALAKPEFLMKKDVSILGNLAVEYELPGRRGWTPDQWIRGQYAPCFYGSQSLPITLALDEDGPLFRSDLPCPTDGDFEGLPEFVSSDDFLLLAAV